MENKKDKKESVIRYQKKKLHLKKKKKKDTPKDNFEQTIQTDVLEFVDENAANHGDDMKNKKQNKKKNLKKSEHRVSRIIASILIFISSVGLVGTLIVSIFVLNTISSAQPLDINAFENPESSVILDANGEPFYDVGAKLIENVEYEEISQSLIDAFVSIEDSRFFEHNGFDIPRFTSAMVKNVFASVKEGGLSFDAGGASTIDMQLTRNSIFMIEDVHTGESVMPASSGLGGIKRKVQEIYYSMRINHENILSKETIFQMYVNRINFGTGQNMLGVQKAAQYYFGKTVSELNLVESAFLAGVINSPRFNTPYYRLSRATDRTHTVLYYMKYHGYITEDEYQRALSVPLENLFVFNEKSGDAYQYQAYADIVLNEVKEITGLDPLTTPMIIETAMVPQLQAEMDRVQNREIDYLDIKEDQSHMQIATTILENATGEVVATIGGYDYYGQRILNRSSQGAYQPGSTAKPFVAYGPAFEYLGYASTHVILDDPYVYPGTTTVVNNWDNRSHGQVTLSLAINDSYNVPALKTSQAVLEKIGKQRYQDYMEAAGFTTYASRVDSYYSAIGVTNKKGRDAFNIQFAIGGSDFYTNTQELAGATAMVMKGGDYIKPHTIRRITIKQTGEVIESPYKATPVLSDAASYLTANAMYDVAEYSRRYSGAFGRIPRNYPVYMKTGTTNWSKDDENRLGSNSARANTTKDRLIVTATDRFSIATWTGFDAEDVSDPDKRTYFNNYELRFNLSGQISLFALNNIEKIYGKGKAITRPSSVSEITHILGTFPYERPVEGMNEDLIVKGYIKSDALSLVDPSPIALEDLKGASVNVSQQAFNYIINVNLEPYPDADKLVQAPNTLEMKKHNGQIVTGTRLYDPSWIFGAVRYKTDLKVNGEIVDTIMSDKEQHTFTLSAFTAGNIEVCSYYTFELNTDRKSHQICNEVNTSLLTVTVPNFTTLTEAQSFSETYGIELNTRYVRGDSLDKFNKIDRMSPEIRGENYAMSALKGLKVTINVFDFEIKASDYLNTSYTSFARRFNNYLGVERNGSGDIIKGFYTTNDEPLSSIALSQYYKKKVVLRTE